MHILGNGKTFPYFDAHTLLGTFFLLYILTVVQSLYTCTVNPGANLTRVEVWLLILKMGDRQTDTKIQTGVSIESIPDQKWSTPHPTVTIKLCWGRHRIF